MSKRDQGELNSGTVYRGKGVFSGRIVPGAKREILTIDQHRVCAREDIAVATKQQQVLGAPTATLRKRFLLRYLRDYAAQKLDLDQLVTESSGATQAFLKEWVHRSVQIALERLGDENQELELRNDDFSRAMEEMKKFSEGSTGRIIGFHAPS